MNDFYHQGTTDQELPAILGLTATPSMRSTIQNLESLEATLDAKCISPTLHREELMKYVKKPQILQVSYQPWPGAPISEAVRSLLSAYHELDISQDPYILYLQSDLNDRNRRRLEKAIIKDATYSRDQIKGLCSRSQIILRQLGPWAADLYIWKAITNYLDRLGRGAGFFDQWSSEEKRYVGDFLRLVEPAQPPPTPQGYHDVSYKATTLLQELLSIEEQVMGIIFAKERVTVRMLWELLVSCPKVLSRYRVGFVLGASNYQGRRMNLYEFMDQADQLALQNFRSGKINLLIATSVLEEGIDVPACNLVICFDSPDTPKAFFQRRGRARMRESQLILLSEQSSTPVKQWEAIEEELKQVYEDEDREVRHLERLEASEEVGSLSFVVEATGARLDFDNAKQHLEHFCRVLSQGEFVDSRPDYILHQHADTSPPKLSATVLLPPTIPEGQRRFYSKMRWLSEKNATKEVAFHAYVALYHAGLVSNNLLPFKFDNMPGVETRAAEVDVESSFQPWEAVAKQWHHNGQKWLYPLSYYDEASRRCDYEVLIPAELDQLRPIELYLSHEKTLQLQFGPRKAVSDEEAARLPDHTSTLLALQFAHRWTVDDRSHVVRISASGTEISRSQIGSAKVDTSDERLQSGQYLVRDSTGTPFLYLETLPVRPPMEQVQHSLFDYELSPKEVPYLVLKRWTKRSDFLHRLSSAPGAVVPPTKRYPWVLPLASATADLIPAKHVQFGMIIPSLIHELEVALTVKELATTLLQDVGISNRGLVREAISARSAAEPLHYERLEFLGDSILKYCCSVQVAWESEYLEPLLRWRQAPLTLHAEPNWPEGYLTRFRDRLVANSRLCRAAMDSGLPKFILTRPFTGHKWRPLYLDNYLGSGMSPAKGRRMSTKTLADVVESLIGASFVDGGIPMAMKCIQKFLPECEWHSIDHGREQLFAQARGDEPLPAVLEPLEKLIGYSFHKKSLLIEAMTHGSYVADSGMRSYERLEFLGDAVLDNIIVTSLFAMKPPLPHYQMHTLKTAMVNGDFLAFVVLGNGLSDLEAETRRTLPPLWRFMRHASMAIGVEQNATTERFEALRGDILTALAHSSRYPWALLARLQAKKFYSDLFEAVLGAVWVDSGSKQKCEAVVARFGIMSCLRRMVRDKVRVQHPKEELGRLALSETVTYDVDMSESSGGDKTFLCRVHVGERLLAEVGGGVNKEEAKTRAAEEAVKRLRADEELSTGEEKA